MHTCLHCQTLFKPQRTNNNNPRKYCTIDCSKKSKEKIITKCMHCGSDTHNPKFCNSSCAASYNNTIKPKRIKKYKICPTCGAEHTKRQFCSDTCNPNRLNMTIEEKYRYARARQNEAWQRYMAKKKNQTPIDANIPAIKEFYLNCPIGYEVDHIHPLSKGGLHTLKNLQYLTIHENRKKSNKIL